MAKPTAAQLQKINRFAKEPLSEEDVYVHKFRLIGTRYIPSRHIRIDASLLDIYKRFVDNGDVGQIADHTFGGLGSLIAGKVTIPFGRFFEGEIVNADGEMHLDGSMYMRAGQKTYIDGFTTDDINDQLDAGTLFDSSVTISWGKSECSICGNDIRDYENCSHWPGRTYKVNGKEVQCYVIAKPAEQNDRSTLYENSIVCAGAYPDAGVLPNSLSVPGGDLGVGKNQKEYVQVNDMADLKLVKKDAPVFCLLSSNTTKLLVEPGAKRDAAELHELYHQMYAKKEELPEGWTMARLVREHSKVVEELISQEEEHLMADALDGTMSANLKSKSVTLQSADTTSTTAKGDDNVEILEQLCELLGCKEEELVEKVKGVQSELSTAQETVSQKETEVQNLQAEIDELKPQAEIGQKYREDLVEEALKWGVRAYGNAFNEEVNRKMLSNPALSLDDIKALKAQYEEVARQEIKTGRVSSNSTGEEGEESVEYDDRFFS